MNDYHQLLNRQIDLCIAAAKKSYANSTDKNKLEGSLAGLEACRGLELKEISSLLTTAYRYRSEARERQDENYWYFRCYEVEVKFIYQKAQIIFHLENSKWLPPFLSEGK